MRAVQSVKGLVVFAIFEMILAGCSSSGGGGGGAGGASQDSGGTTAASGDGSSVSGGSSTDARTSAAAGSGGTSSASKASAGTTATAGSTGSAGVTSAVGGKAGSSTPAIGGSAGAVGGTAAAGRTTVGGASGFAGGTSTGTTGKGGRTGGATLGGRGGTAGTENTGTAGSTGSTDAKPSAGCGKPAPAASTARQTIDVNGTAREYIVVYPTSYDPNRPYRAIFEFHGSTGTAEENIRFQWYGMQPLSGNSAIFIAPQGLGSPTGWANSGGQDVTFVKKLVALINETFCVDTSRIFATGFSYGAMFSNTLGCQMGDVFRAIAPASGGGPNGSCVGQTAAVVIHGAADSTVKISSGEASRDFWLKANHCGTTTKPVEPSPCVLYEGCDAGYPVAWCQHTQGHQILSSFFGPAIWNFISQF